VKIKEIKLNYWSSFMLVYIALDLIWMLAWAVALVFFNPDRCFFDFLMPAMDLVCALLLQLLLSIGPSILYSRVKNKWWLQIFPLLLLVFWIIGAVSPETIWRTCFAIVGMSIVNTVHLVYEYTYWMTENRVIRTIIFSIFVIFFYSLVTYLATRIIKKRGQKE